MIVAVPVSLLTWAAVRLAHDEQQRARQRIRDLLTDRLGDIDRSITSHFAQLERDLEQLTSLDSFSPDEMRGLIRDEPRVLQLFVIRPDGTLEHPDPAGSLNRAEREFLLQATQIIVDRELQRASGQNTVSSGGRNAFGTAQNRLEQTAQVNVSAVPRISGWFVWYWGRGLNLIYWHRRPSGHLVGAALDRARWMADLIATLPETAPHAGDDASGGPETRIRLVDSTLQPVYQWGRFEIPDNVACLCEIPLSAPLSAWSLQQFVPEGYLSSAARQGIHFNLAAGLVAAALGLAAIAFHLYRDYARDMHEAARRVSFVNQVSHELRTPLTNIRLYADLLDADLTGIPDDHAEQPRQRLRVILSESHRLSRLIGNVLTFSGQQRKALRLHPRPDCVDRLVGEVLARFESAFERHGIETRFDAHASETVLVDADAVEQILDNLLNNVEKYADDGKHVSVVSRYEKGRTRLTVSDRGPGIEPALRNEIFEPFRRGSNSLERAAGTGIGLTIARELARLHGGDVTLIDSAAGACFQVELDTPACGEV